LNFTAIDFETANKSHASICAVGWAVVENRKIIDNPPQQLIRPDPLVFVWKGHTEIHGIREEDVRDAPTFAEYWPHLMSCIRNPLIAHKAKDVDMDMLMCALDQCGKEYPKLDYFCTWEIALGVWDHKSYGLKDIADFLGITFEHHNAAEDARACALIAIEACRLKSVESLHDLYKCLNLPIGIFTKGSCPPRGDVAAEIRKGGAYGELRVSDIILSPPTRHRPHTAPKIRAADIKPSSSSMYTGHPFHGKSFAFTGELSNNMTREEAWQSVVDRGGICHDTVKKDTNFLVIGGKGYLGYPAGYKSDKVEKAENMRRKGLPIEILSEADFVRMLCEG